MLRDQDLPLAELQKRLKQQAKEAHNAIVGELTKPIKTVDATKLHQEARNVVTDYVIREMQRHQNCGCAQCNQEQKGLNSFYCGIDHNKK